MTATVINEHYYYYQQHHNLALSSTHLCPRPIYLECYGRRDIIADDDDDDDDNKDDYGHDNYDD